MKLIHAVRIGLNDTGVWRALEEGLPVFDKRATLKLCTGRGAAYQLLPQSFAVDGARFRSPSRWPRRAVWRRLRHNG
jgi:hypothetical protein